jgi:hypothetical protein
MICNICLQTGCRCLFFFDIWILITPLVSSNSSYSGILLSGLPSHTLFVYSKDMDFHQFVILLHDVLLVKYFMEVHLLSWSTEFEFVSFL